MNTIELRTNFHRLIDTFNNESVLSKFYDLLLKAKESKDTQLWSRLSLEEQEELMLIEKQSHDPENLISHSEVSKKHKKWL
ncbi:MAG: hypothetical protein HGB12_10825 [Bacteroidetes bacterium]|nr:hypothetical protein [Bacteroidota bacterium]